MSVDYESDWRGRLRKKIFWQFRNKARFKLWSDGIAAQFQDLEDAIQAMLTLPSIDDSIGAQLDNLGRFVGQPRAGQIDALYRLYLKARILANRSNGTPEMIYAVFTILFGTGMIYLPGWVKQFALRITPTVLTRAQALVGVSFLRDSKEAGARGILEWQESATAALFRFDSGPGFDVGKFTGAIDS